MMAIIFFITVSFMSPGNSLSSSKTIPIHGSAHFDLTGQLWENPCPPDNEMVLITSGEYTEQYTLVINDNNAMLSSHNHIHGDGTGQSSGFSYNINGSQVWSEHTNLQNGLYVFVRNLPYRMISAGNGANFRVESSFILVFNANGDKILDELSYEWICN